MPSFNHNVIVIKTHFIYLHSNNFVHVCITSYKQIFNQWCIKLPCIAASFFVKKKFLHPMYEQVFYMYIILTGHKCHYYFVYYRQSHSPLLRSCYYYSRYNTFFLFFYYMNVICWCLSIDFNLKLECIYNQLMYYHSSFYYYRRVLPNCCQAVVSIIDELWDDSDGIEHPSSLQLLAFISFLT